MTIPTNDTTGRSSSKIAAIALLSSASVLAACAKEAPEDLPPTPAATVAPATTSTAPTASVAGPGTQAHFESTIGASNTVVYFDTDRFNIDSQDATVLQTQAQYLGQYSQVRITIEGHADERGTREYNLALGERRANSAKNYLVSLGIPASRITTVSFGKERPIALGSNESAWAQNRRAASIVIN